MEYGNVPQNRERIYIVGFRNHEDYRNFEFDENVVKPILEMINIRQFQWDGEYSFFPLRNPHSDQRYEELIVQMNNYIEENYDIC